jgi:putative ABC transport system permease protein
VKTVQTKDTLRAADSDFLTLINMTVGILLIAAVVLAAVVLYNLGVLTYVERERELATLKVVGFRTRRIRGLLFSQNTILTAIGAIIGVPLGYWLIGYMLATLSDSMDMRVTIYAVSLILSVVGAFIVSAIVCTALSRRVKTLDMVSALKSVE